MRHPPRWREFARYPATAGTAVLALGVTIAWWSKADISSLFANAEIRRGELWRLLTCTLPHVDVLHLAFNLYWLWVFGTLLEEVYGHLRTAALFVLFAVGASALDFAFDRGGVGLSGVGYGLFGMLWVLARRDPRFHDAVDQRTVNLFLAWFVFCIVTTVTNILPVANIAHGAGLILGVLVGTAIATPARRLHAVAGATALLLFGIWGATLGRPLLNLSPESGYEEAKWGYEALMANRDKEAARWLRDAVTYRRQTPQSWFNLGIAYDRLGNKSAAHAAYQRAHDLDPNNPEYSLAQSP